MMAMWGPVPQPQTILVVAPMYHSTGFTTMSNMLGGDHLVILQKFDAARIVDVIERHRISTFTATPTMLKRIADLPGIDDRDLSSIEWILQGAAPMPPSLVERWIELIGAERILMAYGMTEALGITALRGDEWLQHRGSVGLPQRGTEVHILGPDGAELPAGETGDIYMQAPAYGGSTYLGAGSLDVNTDGLATVGDMGHLDDDGYLYLADRRVDLILSGGANVFPAEVEAALIDHPAVADVVVIGLRDPEWGQRVHAIIEPKEGVAAAVVRRRRGLRQVTPRRVQGAEVGRDRRRHPPQRRHQGQPRRPGRRTPILTCPGIVASRRQARAAQFRRCSAGGEGGEDFVFVELQALPRELGRDAAAHRVEDLERERRGLHLGDELVGRDDLVRARERSSSMSVASWNGASSADSRCHAP